MQHFAMRVATVDASAGIQEPWSRLPERPSLRRNLGPTERLSRANRLHSRRLSERSRFSAHGRSGSSRTRLNGWRSSPPRSVEVKIVGPLLARRQFAPNRHRTGDVALIQATPNAKV
jgi:hypothetical protein